jgi:formylglycine-generating enzyme required for sulfatase activity
VSRHRRTKVISPKLAQVKGQQRRNAPVQSLVILVALLSAATYLSYRLISPHANARTTDSHFRVANVTHANNSASGFEPTIVNRAFPPGSPPSEMVWIPGGEFSMGAKAKLAPAQTTLGSAA